MAKEMAKAKIVQIVFVTKGIYDLEEPVIIECPMTILQDKKGRTALDVAKSIKDILPLGLNDLVLKMERESEGTTMEL